MTLRIPPWTSYNPGAINMGGGNGGPVPIETFTISSADTSMAGLNYLVVSAPPSVAVVGDRIDQGAVTCFIQGIIDQVIFVSDATGFTAGAADAFTDAGGTPVTINETLTINSVNTSINGYPYVVLSGTPSSSNARDLFVKGTAVTYLRAISGQVAFVNSATGLSAGTAKTVEASVGTALTQLDSVSLSSVDTNVTGFNYFTMASAMTNTNTGDIIVQGTAVGYVQDRLNTLIFPNSTSGFSGGSNLVSYEASVSGAGLNWATMDPSQLGTLTLWYKTGTGYSTSGSDVISWANQGAGGATYNLTDGGVATRRPTLNSSDSDFNNLGSILTAYNGAAPVKRIFASDAPALTAASCFMVVKMTNDPAADANTNELWKVSSPANSYPLAASEGGTVNTVQLGTFTNAGKSTLIDPNPALSTTHISTVLSAANNWKWYLNGNLEFSTATNTFAITTGSGALSMGGTGTRGSACKWGEMLVFNAVLSDARIWMAHKHLSVKFAITLKDLD